MDPKQRNMKSTYIMTAILVVVIAVVCVIMFLAVSKKRENEEAKKISAQVEEEAESEIEEEPVIEEEDEETEEPVVEEEAEVVEEPAEEPVETVFEDLDVEAEVEQIRTWYYSPTSSEEKFVLKNGTDGWGYSREYYFHNGELFFVFMFDGTEEHRFYFKDDVMIRYIDENKNTYDYGQTAAFAELEQRVLEESRQFY